MIRFEIDSEALMDVLSSYLALMNDDQVLAREARDVARKVLKCLLDQYVDESGQQSIHGSVAVCGLLVALSLFFASPLKD